MGSEKVLENFLRGSLKVLEKSWIFFPVKEWEPCDWLFDHVWYCSHSFDISCCTYWL